MPHEHETQQSVAAWCEEHYPDESLVQLLLNLVEECTELGCVIPSGAVDGQPVGVPEDLMARTLSLTVAKSDDTPGDPEMIRKEIGDVLISILNLAERVGVDAQAALDAVMAGNRKRRTDESRAREIRKRELGLGDTGQR
jgi:NTP pyrophosphatase (non-canonical NTP hydrolase)